MSIKAAICFVAGVVAGSAATFFAVKGYFEKEKSKAIAEAWKDANEHYKRAAAAKEKAEKNRKEKERAIQKEEESDQLQTEEKQVDIKTIKKNARKAVRSYRRNIFSDPPRERDIRLFEGEEAEEGPDNVEEEEAPIGPSEGLREDPYVISADEFANENRYWDKVTIYVYSDGAVIDENERSVDDIENLIGKENYEKLTELADDGGTVLIRNEMRSTDYEILIMEEPYIPDTIPVRDD